jgi:hypothetical protein
LRIQRLALRFNTAVNELEALQDLDWIGGGIEEYAAVEFGKTHTSERRQIAIILMQKVAVRSAHEAREENASGKVASQQSLQAFPGNVNARASHRDCANVCPPPQLDNVSRKETTLFFPQIATDVDELVVETQRIKAGALKRRIRNRCEPIDLVLAFYIPVKESDTGAACRQNSYCKDIRSTAGERSKEHQATRFAYKF